MRLQLLVPQYGEDDAVIKPLLDSVALQQNADFNEIGVILCNDGGDTRFSQSLLERYPFPVTYLQREHGGVSAARNACLDAAEAEYVMFCDADDMFFNACGLQLLFAQMKKEPFDSLVSAFVEETRDPETRAPVYVPHPMDSTFVHGKVHRREYLLREHIRWNEALTIHEDSYFNILCQNLSEKVLYCPEAFYLWKWRDNSVCRHDPNYILRTYTNMIDSNDALLDAFLARGREDKARFFAGFLIFDAYYAMNKPEWINQANRDYRDSTEQRFSQYYRKRKELWDALPDAERMHLSNAVRSRSIQEGMLMEAVTVRAWLEKMEKLGN